MKQLIPCGDKVPLYKLPTGSLFAHGDDCIAMKSEYMSSNGLIEAYILGSGEIFWGDAKTVEEHRYIMVQPLDIVEAGEDAVPVVLCKDCRKGHIKPLFLETAVWCHFMERCMKLDGFCSCGERRATNE